MTIDLKTLKRKYIFKEPSLDYEIAYRSLMNIYIIVNTHTYLHTHSHTHTHTHTYIRTYTHTHIQTYTDTHKYLQQPFMTTSLDLSTKVWNKYSQSFTDTILHSLA